VLSYGCIIFFFFSVTGYQILYLQFQTVICDVKMVNFGKKLMADQVEEWKGYDFYFGTYEMIHPFIKLIR
jgi:hypothetical protein